MKDNRQKVTGKDELNLIECPFALLTTTAEEGQDKLEFIDKQDRITRRWKILGSREYGLPCSLDEGVYLSLLYLTKRHGLVDRKILFSQYELLKLMRWQVNGERYDRLSLALKRLATVTIETNYLWDRGNFKKGEFLFHVLDEAFISKGKKNSQGSYFVWSKTVFESLANGNIKNLDLETYFNLSTAISRRFFRVMDKRLHRSGQALFNLLELAHERLGISRSMVYPSELKRKLQATLQEHKSKGLLSSASYMKGKNGKWLLNIKRCKENPELLPEKNPPLFEKNLPTGSTETLKENPLLAELISLGIPNKKALAILKEYPHEKVMAWVDALPKIKPENPAGYLIKALSEDWPLHPEAQKYLDAITFEREKGLNEKYNQFIIDQVERHIEAMDSKQLAAEIKEFERLFLLEWGIDKISPVWKSKFENDFKFQKAKKLDLPTFEQWQSDNSRV